MNLLLKLLGKFKDFLHWLLALSIFKKTIIIVIFVLCLFVIHKILGNKNTAPMYQTATVTRGTLVTSISASGTISSGNNAAITTQATGVVNKVYVANGNYVNQGDTIATLVLDSQSQQKQAAAYASYLSAVSSLNSAQSKINSLQSAAFKAHEAFVNNKGIDNPSDSQKLEPQYIIEAADWLQAEADYKNQANVIAASQASLTSAYLTYQQTSATIKAPISGTVSNLNITSGLPILSSSSSSSDASSTQTLGNITLEGVSLTATVNLSEIDVVSIKVGQKVTLTLDAFPDKTFTGKVSAINTNGLVTSGVTTYPTTISFDSAPKNIYPNMAVTARIITSVKNGALLVPTSAIQTLDGENTVRVAKNGTFEVVTVEKGNSSDTQTEITFGLKEGDEVVTSSITTQTGGNTVSPFSTGGFGGTRNAGFGGSVQIRTRQR